MEDCYNCFDKPKPATYAGLCDGCQVIVLKEIKKNVEEPLGRRQLPHRKPKLRIEGEV